MKVLVAIPCYNCEKQIPRVIGAFDKKLAARVEKIVAIDNGSTDNTIAAAKKAAKKAGLKNIEVVKNNDNYGLGGTHKVAFSYGEKLKMDYVAILHGDNQAMTEELKTLLDIAEKEPEVSAILGSRFAPGARLEGYSALRTWGNRGLNFIYTLVTFRLTQDLGSGLNLFRLKDLSDHRYLGFTDKFTFNIDLLLDYFKKGCRLKFVPITWSETDQVSNARTFGVGWTALKTVLRWRFLSPVRIDRKPSDYTFKKVPR